MTDIWQTLKSRRGLLALILNLLPLGTGAAGFLFAGIAKDWHAGADTVALVTGGLGGAATILGCLIGGWISDRIHKQKAFVLFSLLQGACYAAASKFEIYASASYLPLYFMFWVSGSAYSKWGASGMLNIEAAVAVLAAATFFAAHSILKKSRDLSMTIGTL